MAIIDESRWRFVLTDMNGATNTGGGLIINSQQKQFNDNLNNAKTAQCTLDITHPLADFAINADCLMKVYRKDRLGSWHLLINGDVMSQEEDGTGGDYEGSITIGCADPWWRVQHRFLGTATNVDGSGVGYTEGTNAAPIDAATVCQNILQTLIDLYPIGFTIAEVDATGTLTYIGPIYITNAGDTLSQVVNSTGGPEIEFVPNEPSGVMPNTQIATAHIRVHQGQLRPNAAFEYGTGLYNVAQYSRIRAKTGQCNIAYSPPQGFPSAPAAGDNMLFTEGTNLATVGMYQDIVQSDVASIPLRQELCNEYVTVRQGAQQQLSITPAPNCDLDYTVDYICGDVVTARAWINGEVRFNGTTRIFGVGFTVDENDVETPTLTLIPSSASGVTGGVPLPS